MERTFIDISRELTSAPLYPGDPAPVSEKLSDLRMGDEYTTTLLHACVHTGTHIDAPCHFLSEGKGVDELPLSRCCGDCFVVEASGALVGEQLEKILWMMPSRVLFKGNVTLTQSAAFVLADAGVRLVGVEGASIASAADTGEIHRQLLSAGVILLEGLDLSDVRPGEYVLFAAPIKIKDCDGAPVRALLMKK